MEKNKFKHLQKYLNKNSPKGKATAEEEASKNPKEFLKKNKNMSLKNLKGVAF